MVYDDTVSKEENTLRFVNAYRESMGVGLLAKLPERTDHENASYANPLAQALGFPVYRTFEHNVFTDLNDHDAVKALFDLNCPNTPYRIPSTAPTRYDVRLPWYTWEFAR